MSEEGLWIVRFVATDPEYEGRGLAKIVVSMLHREAQANGAKTAELESVAGIENFYKSLGYSAIGPGRKDFKVDHIRMRRHFNKMHINKMHSEVR
jgi:predicted GNAT family N-acyltransferase